MMLMIRAGTSSASSMMLMIRSGTSSASSHPACLTHFRLRRRRLSWSVVLGLWLALDPSPHSGLMVVVRLVRMLVVMVGVVVVRVVVQRFLLAVYTAHVVMMTESKLSGPAVPPHTCTSPQSPAVTRGHKTMPGYYYSPLQSTANTRNITIFTPIFAISFSYLSPHL